MKKLAALLILACAVCQAAPIAKIYRWDSRVEDGPSFPLAPTRGETMVLQPRLLSYGSPIDLTTATAVTMLYKATGSTNVYSVAGGLLLATNGQAQVIWTSSNEMAASSYSYDIMVASPTTTVLGAWGTIKYRDGVAYGGAHVTNAPVHVLDFASTIIYSPGLSPWVMISDLTGLVAGVTSITNTPDILRSGSGTGAQGLTLTPTRLASLARADLALTNPAAFDPAGSAAAAALASVPTSRTFAVNGTIWNMTTNGSMTITSGGNVASVTGAGGLTNLGGATTGAVTLTLSAGTVASLARADAALTNAGQFATAAQGANADLAYGWGNHATGGYATGTPLYAETLWIAASGTVVYTSDGRLSDARTPTAHDQAWSTITSTPTTLLGYGITDGAGGADSESTNYFRNAGNLTNLTAAGIATNAGAAGGGYYVMSNGTWTAITVNPFTNGTTMSDGKLGGSNGVYWLKNGTNFWILFP